MGMPIVAMGLLGLTMPTVEAAAILVVPSFVMNVWQMWVGPGLGPLARRLATMMIAICIGTWLGIGFMTGSAQAWAPAALGGVMALYGLMALYAPRFAVPRRQEAWASPVVGASTGLIAGGTGLFVVPMVPYMSALGLAKDELIQGLGMCFVVCSIAMGVALGFHGQISPALAGISTLSLVPAAVGMYVGQRFRGRLDPEAFRRWFFRGLIALGLYMALRTLLR
jgi:uncharacterized membrane protein YfcA